jgi:NitT/TauT family transport system permease protein
MIVEYANVFATAKLFVPIIVIAIIGVVLTERVRWLERRMSRWRQLERERFERGLLVRHCLRQACS